MIIDSIGFGAFIVLLALTLLELLVVRAFKLKTYSNLSMYFFVFGFFVYSGLGICLYNINSNYLFSYFLFGFVFIVSFSFAAKRASKTKCYYYRQVNSKSFLKGIAFLYWALLLLKVVYPISNINKLLHPTFSLTGVFSKAETSSIIEYLSSTFMLLFKPFYYVYLFKEKKPSTILFLLILEMYIGFALNGYIARSGFISQVIFILIAFYVTRIKNKPSSSVYDDKKTLFSGIKRIIIVLFVLVLLSSPVLLAVEFIRLGRTADSSMTILGSVDKILGQEISFPSSYDFCVAFHKGNEFFRYVFYLIGLPFPKRIFGAASSYYINQEFSIGFTGITYGADGFSIVLPGLLGEGFIICGPILFCIFALLIGYILGTITGHFEKNKEMSIWSIYLAINILLMCRGGSQSAIAIFINGSILVFVLSMYNRLTFGREKSFFMEKNHG